MTRTQTDSKSWSSAPSKESAMACFNSFSSSSSQPTAESPKTKLYQQISSWSGNTAIIFYPGSIEVKVSPNKKAVYASEWEGAKANWEETPVWLKKHIYHLQLWQGFGLYQNSEAEAELLPEALPLPHIFSIFFIVVFLFIDILCCPFQR